MRNNIEITAAGPAGFRAAPAAGPMSGPAAFAVLNQHVLRTLPASPARRGNLLRALAVCAALAARPSGGAGTFVPPSSPATHEL
jgi:hypothetical protein